MSFEKNVIQTIAYEYDFAIDGGAIGAKELRSLNVNKLKSGLLIVEAELKIITALAGASATAVIGDADDDNGYFLEFNTVAAGNYSSHSIDRGGAFLRSTVATSPVAMGNKLIKEVLADRPVLLTVGTAALTAGKFEVIFHCYQK